MEQTVHGAPRPDGFAPPRVKRVVRETADAVSSEIESFVAAAGDADVYICGPEASMDTVETTVLTLEVPADRVYLERFDVVNTAVQADTVNEEVTVQPVPAFG